jgi:membrane-bound lytic murein transglycosylase A
MKFFLLLITISAASILKAQHQTLPELLGRGYDFENNGKRTDAPLFREVFQHSILPDTIFLANQQDLKSALNQNLNYLRRISANQKTFQSIGNKAIANADMQRVNNLLLNMNTDSLLSNRFIFYQLSGEDNRGNVQYTSYYIPIIEVSDTQDSIYKYPIFKKPTTEALQNLTRKEIDLEGKLKGKNLELAYAKNYFDLHSMQVQGSGYAQYPNGERYLFSYGGKNNKSYRSLGRYLNERGYIAPEDLSLSNLREWFIQNPDSMHVYWTNPSYVYFQKLQKEPSGAAGIPLIPGVSVAADSKVPAKRCSFIR